MVANSSVDYTASHKFLLIFGPNNKKVEIESNDVGASKSELHAAAVKTFGLGGSELILQLYDRDFSDYVDIEDGELFYGPAKLRVVKGQEQPATFPVTINNAEDSINAEISDSGSTVSQLDYTAGSDFLRDNSDFSLLTPNSPSPPPTPNAYSTPVSIEQPSTSSSADDPPSLPAAPLTSSLVSPHPTSPVSFHSGWITKFQIPVQPPTIESKLKSGGYTMNVAERSLFLDSIYKEVTEKYGIYYPSKAQYDEIITKLFVKYPSMKTPQDNMPVGNLKMLWKHRLQYKFQNFRKRVAFEIAAVQKKKLKVARKPKSAPESPAAPPQWGMKNYLPNRPETEDDASIDGHICWLQDEKRKRQPDFRGVSQSMALTLADRRTWIISSPQTPSLADIKSKYPWLFDDIQLLTEMNRIQDGEVTFFNSLRAGLGRYASGLIKACKGKRAPHAFFMEATTEMEGYREEQKIKDTSNKAAFLAIPGLLQEDISLILVPACSETSNPVYIKMDGDTPGITTSFKLMADGMVINSTDNVMKAIACWISSFYVFNFFYPSSISKSLCFIQRVILNIYDGVPVPRSIISLTNKLANFSQQCK
ncbi:sterile alpha motif domain-containing protein 3-like isoform X3 [Apostichopus japonicus]|uniref:sterile alpha motif domain-containing protein 3-like isoform X3 n=1 Tax=Stichopus japonicus TaxID=307972 RepID=UPI003AB7831C